MIRVAFIIPVKIDVLNEQSKIFTLIQNFFAHRNKRYQYNFYLGFNFQDPCLRNIRIFDRFMGPQFTIHCLEFESTIKTGHLTVMWNKLFEASLQENDYFYQLGDDILFDTYDFLDLYIDVLRKSHNVGVTGFLTKNGNTKILTQSFVSKKHYDIFGFYFPEAIINWFCDNWISDVYRKHNLYFPLANKIVNSGGKERYVINQSPNNYLIELDKGSQILKQYLNRYLLQEQSKKRVSRTASLKRLNIM